MKNILYVDFSRKNNLVGGGQIWLKNLIININNKKYRAHILSLNNNDYYNNILVCKKIKTLKESYILDNLSDKKHKIIKNPLLSFLIILYFIKFNILSFKILKKNDINIIHANGVLPGILFCFPAVFLRIPLLYHVHHVPNNLLGCLVNSIIGLFAKKVFCVSEYVKKNGFLGMNKNRKIIYNGIKIDDIYTYSKIKKKNEIVFIANFIEGKGHEWFINSISLIKNELRERKCKIYLIGDGPLLDQIKNKVKNLKLDDLIYFTGFIKDGLQYLGQSKILISASTKGEAFGLTILEGIKTSNVIIATNIGATSEIIYNGKTGILIAPYNKYDLSRNILNVVDKYDSYKNILNASLNILEKKFTLNMMINKIEEHYDNILYEGNVCN